MNDMLKEMLEQYDIHPLAWLMDGVKIELNPDCPAKSHDIFKITYDEVIPESLRTLETFDHLTYTPSFHRFDWRDNPSLDYVQCHWRFCVKNGKDFETHSGNINLKDYYAKNHIEYGKTG